MSTDLFDLHGKTALVTGGTRGIGMAIALGLARAGANIVINGTSADTLESARAKYADQGIEVHTSCFDVTDETAVEEAIAAIERDAGPIDILVNNAGINLRIPALEMKAEESRKVIDIDLTGPFITAKTVARGMIERGGGKIINSCSMMSELGRDTLAAYSSAKGGLKMLTRNMATEWARHNIQVNGIGPGYFATEQTKPIRVDGHPFNEFIVGRTPAGR